MEMKRDSSNCMKEYYTTYNHSTYIRPCRKEEEIKL